MSEKKSRMGRETETILIRQISLSPDASDEEIFAAARHKLNAAVPPEDVRSLGIYRHSVDARHPRDVRMIYTVSAEVTAGAFPENVNTPDLVPLKSGELRPVFGTEKLEGRPVVVGFGPAGMFASLLLCELGYRPIVLERGGDVEERVASVEKFRTTGELDVETNVQFGAGGAGTFSDGKLMTRINDSLCDYVMRRFHDFGAPDEILSAARPHIGTDRLREVVSRIRDRIRELGGEVRFHCRLDAIHTASNGRIDFVETSQGPVSCGAVILGVGHSARDTYEYLKNASYPLTPKPISVGVRIEHKQADIDCAMYGSFAGHPRLGHAEYNLSRRTDAGAVYTFCMCPGGEVITAASEEGRVVTNGMSYYRRDGENANSAVVVSVSPDDPMAFQRMLEEKAYLAGGGNFFAPVQTVGDFLSGRHGTEPSRILPTYGGGRVRLADLSSYLPDHVTSMLKLGLSDFDRRIRGFAVKDAVLTGFETRTSAPYRLCRNEAFCCLGAYNLYPAGEGAGYAGGITSAAVDGIRCAMALAARYARPLE